ncbi:MAG: hypothetical protein JSS21_09865 [Proteobacteria bacterium]|nr:hypothetical protein [Pseudomonadota bacterium]
MRSFEEVRSHLSGKHKLKNNDPYLLSFDLAVRDGRHQGMYLVELEDEEGNRYLRVSTPIGPLVGMDAKRCLRFNWEQRTGFLAVSDLDGAPYLHLCENRPYSTLNVAELDRLIAEIGPLADQLEQAITAAGDAY